MKMLKVHLLSKPALHKHPTAPSAELEFSGQSEQAPFPAAALNEQIELQAKLLNYFLGSNKSNINQFPALHYWD